MIRRKLNADLAHELRSHISIARGHAELIRAENPGRQAAGDAEVILDELDRLSIVSDRLLLLSVTEHRRMLRRAPVDVRHLVEDAAERWRGAGPRRWVVSVAADGTLLGDEGRLASALDMLLENAVKFTSGGDRIALQVRPEGRDTAVIEVSDGGPGIPPEHLPRIFDRFFRAQNGGREGTGLGLPVVKAIVRAHHGSVTVKSEVGTGTTFEIRLRGFRRVGAATR